jgi:hypothetical protein
LIRSDVLGELKDSAAGVVALSELLGSRRVGPKAIAAALPSAHEACAGVASAVEALAADVLSVLPPESAAIAEVRAVFERAVTSVRALEAEVAASGTAPGDARIRLVLERAANAASANVAASLFVAELFAQASEPRVVSIRVADVLGFGPVLPEGPNVVRATLDAPPAPVATTDARLLRSLVELAVQIVAAAGVPSPHIHVSGSEGAGARIRIGAPPTPLPPSAQAPVSTSYPPRRAAARPPAPAVAMVAVKRLPWSESAFELARAAATIAGADVSIDATRRGVTIAFA